MYAVRYLDRYDDLLAVHASHPERYPCLLESAACGTAQGRFDILFGFPQATLTWRAATAHLQLPAGWSFDERAGSFLDALDQWWRQEHRWPAGSSELPFRGGWFVYLGYEMAGAIEPQLALPVSSHGLPDAVAVRMPAAIIRDHQRRRIALVAEPGYAGYLDELAADLTEAEPVAPAGGASVVEALAEDPPDDYLEAVDRVRRYILDGDVFQANLSRAWRGRLLPGTGAAITYARLRAQNPGPFAGLFVHEAGAVISSSPERLIRVAGGQAETRPIAGTRPRGARGQADQDLSRELMAHPKERAEHVMLIDLERNDLGRVSIPGTVRVTDLMALESYAHVHHIVSNVTGRLVPGTTPGQVLAALFPGGTITGCPKVRCMEIIAELERTGRGPYTGSMGYLNRDGDMDFNILIRTLVQAGQAISLRAGAGIVADSQPQRELEETRAKAKGLLRALESFDKKH